MKYLYWAIQLTLLFALVVSHEQIQSLLRDTFTCSNCLQQPGTVYWCCNGCTSSNGSGPYYGKGCQNCVSTGGLSATCPICLGTCNSTLLIPIYRCAGPNGDHVYSQISTCANSSYVPEQQLGLGWTGTVGSGYVPLVEWVTPDGTAHYYTTLNSTEGVSAGSFGYLYTGIICYLATTWTQNVDYQVNRFRTTGTPKIYLLTLNPTEVGNSTFWYDNGVLGYMPTRYS